MPGVIDLEKLFDIAWTADGDLFIDNQTKDIGFFGANENLILEGAILKRLQSNTGDWKMFPSLGCNLSEFIGKPNDPNTAAAIHNRIVRVLTEDGLVKPNELEVDIIPLDKNKILVLIEAKALVPNVLEDGTIDNTILVGFSYDMRDNRMIPRIIGV